MVVGDAATDHAHVAYAGTDEPPAADDDQVDTDAAEYANDDAGDAQLQPSPASTGSHFHVTLLT